MKSTGIVRKIDDLGRVCIPKELRRTMNLEVCSPIEIFTEGDAIVLKQFSNKKCMCCEEESKKLEEVAPGKYLCNECSLLIRGGNNV